MTFIIPRKVTLFLRKNTTSNADTAVKAAAGIARMDTIAKQIRLRSEN